MQCFSLGVVALQLLNVANGAPFSLWVVSDSGATQLIHEKAPILLILFE